MRIESLTISRYGAIEERSLDLASDVPLTIVYGPNEAGKSTSLAAVKDFLFGVPERTPKTLMFGAEALRLTASLRMADGRLLTYRRRKGRSRTLTDADGAPVEEIHLTSLLGGVTRERFETFFGLDHHSLRSGGADLLTAEGEIGRLIVEAGGGLRPLVQRLARLEAEIDGLFNVRRSADRAFYKAVDAFAAADSDAKAGALSPTQFERLRSAVEEAERRRDELRDGKAVAVQAHSKTQRSVRVGPALRRLDEARAALAALDDLPALPDDFEERVANAEQRRATINQTAAKARSRAEELATRIAGLDINASWNSAEAEILDLAQKRAIVAKQREDRPNRLKELAEAEQKLAALRRRLAAGPEEDLAGRLPPTADVDKVRTLAAEAQRRESQLEGAAAQVAAQQAELSQLQQRVEAAQKAARHEALGVTAAEIASLPSAAQAAELRRRQAQAALAKAQEAATALGFGDLEALEKTPFPSSQRVADELRALQELEADQLAQAKAAREAEAEQALQASEAERLAQGGAPATDETVRAAREARGKALAPLRDAHRAGRWAADAEARVHEVDEADRAIAEADDLADRRAAEATRAAQHAQAIRLGDAAAVKRAAAESEAERLRAAVEARIATLARAFPLATQLFAEPRALEDAAVRREAILGAVWQARKQLEEAEADEGQLLTPRETLAHVERACGLVSTDGATTSERVRKALAAIAAHDEAHADFRRDTTALEKNRIDLKSAHERLDGLKVAQAAWSSAWSEALPKLGLNPQLSPDEAAAAAMEWAAADGVLTTLSIARRRLERMDQDEADLGQRANTLGERLGLQLPEDALAKAELLQRRWTEHQALLTRHEALAAELQKLQKDAVDGATAAEEAKTAFEALCGLAGVAGDDDGALADVRRRHLERRGLQELEQQLLGTLTAAGDGLSEAELRTAWQGADPDTLSAEEARLAGDVEALDAAHAQAIESAVKARTDFETALDEQGVNAALTAREAAIADLHLIIERYVPLALARDLLKGAIAKARAEHQAPLIARAGTLMSTLTRGTFSGVSADIDDKGHPVVVGVNRAGAAVPVGLMSDGTRDQLYLAFRLAGLESYCAGAEPLPFVADDLLVHFDDARTAAALEVLADFGSVTQVLLFTHHESVRDAAAPLLAAGRAQVVELS